MPRALSHCHSRRSPITTSEGLELGHGDTGTAATYHPPAGDWGRRLAALLGACSPPSWRAGQARVRTGRANGRSMSGSSPVRGGHRRRAPRSRLLRLVACLSSGSPWSPRLAAKRAFFGVLLGTSWSPWQGRWMTSTISPRLQIAGQGDCRHGGALPGRAHRVHLQPFAADGSVLFLGDLGRSSPSSDHRDHQGGGSDRWHGWAGGRSRRLPPTIALMASRASAAGAHRGALAGALSASCDNFNRRRFSWGRWCTPGFRAGNHLDHRRAQDPGASLPWWCRSWRWECPSSIPICYRAPRERRPISPRIVGYLHHRLLNRGLSQRQTVLVLYGVTVACAVALAIFHYTVG